MEKLPEISRIMFVGFDELVDGGEVITIAEDEQNSLIVDDSQINN